MASMCGKRLKYLRNGFTMLEMTYEFDKRPIQMRNDIYIYMWEMASLFEKRLKCVGNDVDLWEMVKAYGKCLKYVGNGLTI